MRLFITSAVDHRKLSQPWHRILRQHPGRREHIHGRIHEMHCKCASCSKVAA